MDIAIYLLLTWSGIIVGFLLCWWIAPWLRSYSGVIIAKPDMIEDKVIYSLILFKDPEALIYEKEVLFRVDKSDTSVEEFNRE